MVLREDNFNANALMTDYVDNDQPLISNPTSIEEDEDYNPVDREKNQNKSKDNRKETIQQQVIQSIDVLNILPHSPSLQDDGSYIQDSEDDKVLLNSNTCRQRKLIRSLVRNPHDSLGIRQVPFRSLKHASIFPVNDETLVEDKPGFVNDGSLKRSESATLEIKKMRESLLQKHELRKKQKSFLDDDKVLIGNKVSEGHVNFIIAYNMLTGIRVAVSRCSGIMKPLTINDFRFTKKLAFDYHGNELTPSSQYAFKFKDYCPEVFRELRALFGLDPADYLMSLTSKYILSELNSPGKSGSFFYFSRDYKYIMKTIHHAEHCHLRKMLRDYYCHVKDNPDTLISQFYGLHRVKMPISFKNKIKHRKIYFIVMNNLFPPHLDVHTIFDLKGSTFGRLTNYNTKSSDKPILKDLNWLQEERSIQFGPLKKKFFLHQLKRDIEFLSRLNIMDYSLLFGIHDMELEKDLIIKDEIDIRDNEIKRNSMKVHEYPLSMILRFFQQDEGGIRASDYLNRDLNQIYYIGIIDCLTNYSIVKRLETFWRGLNHDLKVISAVPPKDYGERFYQFIEDSVNRIPTNTYCDDPNRQSYRD